MPIELLMAGCSEEERERVGQLVRSVIGDRAADASWRVSLVKIGGRWSMSLDGPDERLKGKAFTVPEAQLRDAMLESLRQAEPTDETGQGAGAALEPGGDPRRDSHQCGKCRQPFVVLYELREGESLRKMPVACPHCWQMNYVEIGQWAASGREYRAEKT